MYASIAFFPLFSISFLCIEYQIHFVILPFLVFGNQAVQGVTVPDTLRCLENHRITGTEVTIIHRYNNNKQSRRGLDQSSASNCNCCNAVPEHFEYFCLHCQKTKTNKQNKIQSQNCNIFNRLSLLKDVKQIGSNKFCFM